MRAMGVPARVVTGYQAPSHCRSMATTSCARVRRMPGPSTGSGHRLDPRRPDRRRRARPDRAQPAPRAGAGFVAGALGRMDPELLAELRNSWETINNRWNQWVLNYSRGSSSTC